ncbi:MAG: spore germination protein [Bacillota bacterium]
MKRILPYILRLITYKENPDSGAFVLEETPDEKKSLNDYNASTENQPDKKEKIEEKVNEKSSSTRNRRPKSLSRRNRQKQEYSQMSLPEQSTQSGGPKKPHGENLISPHLDYNREIIKLYYGLPRNKDIVIREFELGTTPGVKSMLVFTDGLVDKTTINHLLQSMMFFSDVCIPGRNMTEFILSNLLPAHQVRATRRFEDVLYGVNSGDSAFFFQGSDAALMVETKGMESRSVDKPNTEQTIRGPQEGFTEILRVNTALIRKYIRTSQLTTEFFKVGDRFPNDIAIVYVRDLANPSLVEEVKRRIQSIRIDFMPDSGMLEGMIEDHPYNLNPQTIATERPDRVASYLAEGKVSVLVHGSPQALVMPATMYDQLHTGEESYLRWQYGTFIRYVRVMAFYMSFLLPGTYLAVVLYHQEMVPTELLLAIAGNRERVPFPSVVEMLLMELSFELVREAGVRIPGIIGTTIGIVGALILGQASVQANIVSPILVVLVAVTGLASFAMPNFALSFALRIYRFIYIFLGAMLGFFGITIGLFVQILLTVNLRSFGVPYLAPSGPRTAFGKDVVFRLPLFTHEKRPDYINPQDVRRAPRISRGWVLRKGREKSEP